MKRHRSLISFYAAFIVAVVNLAPSCLWATLSSYDAVIAADHGEGAGVWRYEAVLLEAVTVDGTDSVGFDFGDISGDATFEFILEGDPVDSGDSAYLAVGENAGNNLRYEQWRDTTQLGFTRLGTADNLFTAEGDESLIESPDVATHLAFVWQDVVGRMDLYVDGALAGSNDGAAFEMPTGEGFLGNNSGNSEGMAGTIHRVTIYNEALSTDAIQAHAEAWLAEANGSDPALVTSGTLSLTFDGSVQSFTTPVRNIGMTNELTVSRVEVTGANAANFDITTPTPFTVLPGESVDVAFTFSPNGATGQVSASFVFESNDVASPFNTEVNGLIYDPKISLSVETLDFGSVTEPASRMIEVSNAGGTQDLVIDSATIVGADANFFTVSDPVSVSPKSLEMLSITFNSGGASGAFEAMLVLASNDPVVNVVNLPLNAQVPISDAVLVSFDAFIDGDQAQYPYEAVMREATTFDGSDSREFDFGDLSDSATIEFIVEGDPEEGGASAYLAVGENEGDNLRFEQWRDTSQLGFTRLGVADYVFEPEGEDEAMMSPQAATHVTYRWDADDAVMSLFINGVLAGSNVDAGEFTLPMGSGFLGNNSGGSEGLVGTIHRVVTYNEALPDEAILNHAMAFLEPGSSNFEIREVVRNADGTVFLSWDSAPGRFYAIETSPDLSPVTWTRVLSGITAEPEPSMLTSSSVPAAVDQSMGYFRVVQVAPPALLETSFENGLEDWAVDGIGTAWEIGSPTMGPGSARTGQAVAVTGLGMGFEDGTRAHLRTPVLDPGGVTGSIQLEFWYYLDANEREGGQVSLVEEDGTLIQNLEPIFIGGPEGNTEVWTKANLRLPTLEPARPFRIQFNFLGDDDGFLNNGLGWYLDDVRVD